MKQKLEKNIAMTFRVTEQERDLIREAQKESGIINMRAYLLKMAVNGLNIRIDLDSVREMNRLLSNASSNINQIAKRANETTDRWAQQTQSGLKKNGRKLIFLMGV